MRASRLQPRIERGWSGSASTWPAPRWQPSGCSGQATAASSIAFAIGGVTAPPTSCSNLRNCWDGWLRSFRLRVRTRPATTESSLRVPAGAITWCRRWQDRLRSKSLRRRGSLLVIRRFARTSRGDYRPPRVSRGRICCAGSLQLTPCSVAGAAGACASWRRSVRRSLSVRFLPVSVCRRGRRRWHRLAGNGSQSLHSSLAWPPPVA